LFFYGIIKLVNYPESTDKDPTTRRLEIAGLRAVGLSYKSAFENGQDVPIGAIAMRGDAIVGNGYAVDNQHSARHLHAEVVAIKHANVLGIAPDVIVSTVEACERCQVHLAQLQKLTTFAFVLSRQDLVDHGLVTPRPSMIERATRGELGYNVVQLDNPYLRDIALAPIMRTSRDIPTGAVHIDREGIQQDRARLVDEYQKWLLQQ
jgi:tRNA(Arg) A34 adenosine deaminase TadA